MESTNGAGDLCSDIAIHNATCDSELGGFTNTSSSPLMDLKGIYQVIPSGIPDRYPLPFLVTLLVNPTICEKMGKTMTGIGAAVLVNHFETKVLATRVSTDLCEIVLQIQTNGELKPGPAILSLFAVNSQGATEEILINGNQACPYFHNLGVSLGRLYVYKNPSQNATIIASRALNADCALFVLVKMPFFTQTMLYGEYFCYWKNQGDRLWREASPSRAIFDPATSARGVQCHIAGSTSSRVLLKVSINGLQGTFHQLSNFITRLGDPSSAIPGEGSFRIFSISPNSGPRQGGTLLTVRGKYFSNFCNPEFCTDIQCQFVLSDSQRIGVDATVTSDNVLTCTTPTVSSQFETVQVQVSTDPNPACNVRTNSSLPYNSFSFHYQSDVAVQVQQSSALWYSCNPSAQQSCDVWPNINQSVQSLGYYTCLSGFTSQDKKSTSPAYPVWCIRALPIDAGRFYQFTITDPFMKLASFVVRKVPVEYPGYCNRANLSESWSKIETMLDYRVFDLYDRTYSQGDSIPVDKETQGKRLVDKIFSTAAANASNLTYMKDALNAIGQRYGFLDLSLVFAIEMDFTLAANYSEANLRLSTPCALYPAKFGQYSGFYGERYASTGNYINWTEAGWLAGKPACVPVPGHENACSDQIKFSPNMEDPIGVMLTQPATIETSTTISDDTMGCGRLRASFDCSNFSLDDCITSIIMQTNPNAFYRNMAARQPYKSGVSWCDFTYPEQAGPNNLGEMGWRAGAAAPGNEDWRYFYRESPCVRCRQAQEICNALQAEDKIVNNIPVGPYNLSLGDKQAAIEINLGCFGGAAEDECCDDVSNFGLESSWPMLKGRCIRTLERCVRPSSSHVCARDDDANGVCSDPATGQLPLCTPR
mmetsp:Transcript_45077/g.141899  ORF Transcript_45077/g.141899 Transcript_45077/m.141899 type:complete len:877 (-) Transcript_45077:118-2748(-)